VAFELVEAGRILGHELDRLATRLYATTLW
jgi:hypothetical protein